MDNYYTITDNFSIDLLFISKEVSVLIRNEEVNEEILVKAPVVKEILTNQEVLIGYQLLKMDISQLNKDTELKIKSSWEWLQTILFRLGQFKTYSTIALHIRNFLEYIFISSVSFDHFQLKIGNININEQIWDYLFYIIKLIYGEKSNKPLDLSGMSEGARKFYLAQLENEKIISRIRQTGRRVNSKGEEIKKEEKGDEISKILLNITYSFPSFTFDYLLNQTMAQILWLQSYAAGAMSYEVNAKAFAAGNFKKGQTLKPFIN